MSHDPNSRRPHRQDTFDLRGQMQTDGTNAHMHHEEEHSIMEDDSADDRGDEDDGDEFMDDDDEGDSSSSLSIPNESIDFDLVYSLHTFVATVEGQANVVKGDSLFLMDDSNSYWWLVRVLKTQEVGYIPAENIETPYERLARLNKHRNVDVSLSLSLAFGDSNPVALAGSGHPRRADIRPFGLSCSSSAFTAAAKSFSAGSIGPPLYFVPWSIHVPLPTRRLERR